MTKLMRCSFIFVMAALSSAFSAKAHAEAELLFGSEREVPVAELLDLLDILPGVSTDAQVSASANGPFGDSADLSGDGRLTCRAEGDDVVLAAGDGPAVSGTCYARVCTTTLALLEICGTHALEVRSTACLASGPGVIDPGCAPEQPICTGGADARCVGCLDDLDCGVPSGTFGLGLGEVAHVTVGLLTELLGLDLGVPLSTVQVSADVNGPFSDQAVLQNGVTCALTADGSVDLTAEAEASGASTCFVEACVPLLGTCLVAELDTLVDGCLLGGDCYPIATCDLQSNTCVACRDNRDPGYIDRGCGTDEPVCYEAGAAPTCVACMEDVDCRGKLLTVALGPNRTTVLELERIMEVLRLGTTLLPSSVKVGASADGPFADEALLDADAALSGCAVDADGDVFLTAAGAEGRAVCHVQVCASLLGDTVETCLVAPIDVTVDLCVLDRSCDLEPRCDSDGEGTFTCTDACRDDAPAGGIDSGCDATAPACAGSCVECQEDADCLPKRPLLDLDLSEVGEVARSELLAALMLDADVLVDSLKVGATVDGPFQDLTTLDVQGEVAQCLVDVDGDVQVIATATVYGQTTCYVEVCAALFESISTCLVMPIAINVDPCAQDDSCRPPICDATVNHCVACIDAGDGVDPGCGAELPFCVIGDDGDNRCAECDDDVDCPAGAFCNADKSCEYCSDTTIGGVDLGCEDEAPACDEAPLSGGDPSCVECTHDADCPSGVCDEPNRRCVECVVDADCPGGVCLADNTCGECENDADCPSGVCDEPSRTCHECLVDADCPGGVCHDGACETCVDLGSGVVDEGCAAPEPACDVAPVGGGDPRCVECTHDSDCPSALCDEGARLCVDCQDTAPGDALDLGCRSEEPICLPQAGGGRGECVECLADAHCAPGERCDMATNTCGPCEDTTTGGTDLGCAEELPACDVAPADGGTAECVECTDDADCDSEVCDEPNRRCVVCVDSTDVGVDDGCDDARPECVDDGDGSGDGRCVECDDDADCAEGSCDPAAGRCVDPEGVIAADDRYEGGFGLTLVVSAAEGVLANDRGPGGATDLQARVVTGTQPDPDSQGELVLAADGSFVFIPKSGFSGRVEVSYEASVPGGTSAIGRLTIEIGDNQPPRAGDEAVATDEDTAVLVAVLANDVDPEGHGLRVTALGAPFYGTVELRTDMTVIYRPAPEFIGIDAFDYEVCDAFDACAGATVAVTVRPVNDAPQAADDFVVSVGDVVVTIDVLANDGDPDGDALHVDALDTEAGDGHDALVGRVEIIDGVVVFTPAVGFAGTTGFGYRACDDHGACDTARVTVQVGEGEVEPLIEVVDDFIETRAGTAATIHVLANDRALAGGDLTMGAWGRARSGTVAGAPDGTVTYLPAPGFVGEDAFSYTACVGDRCALAMVWVTVTEGDNHAPVAVDDLVTTTVDTAVVFDPRENDLDVDGDPLGVAAVGVPSFGQASRSDEGTVTYVPAPGFVGDDAFWVEIDDGRGGVDRSTVTVIVLPRDNLEPLAEDDSFEVAMTPLDAEPVATLLDVLANDSDPDGDPIVIDVVMQPDNGLATIDETGGGIAYAPRGGFVGTDVLYYRVSDGRGGFDVATVTIVVGSVDDNQAPEVVDDEIATPEDEAVTIDVLVNDTDPDGDPLSVELADGPTQGSVTLLDDGRFTYTPRADFFGDDGFSYTACDEGGACATADVMIEVTPVNDRPVARDDRGTMLATAGGAFDVLANDSDVDGDLLVVAALGVPDVGAVAREDDGRLSVTAPAGFSGRLSFSYEACDPDGLCDEALVEIDVTGQATGPSAGDDEAATQANVAVTIDVLANDNDPQGDTLAIQSVSFPAVGGARVVDGAVVYTPAEDWVGVDNFQYVVCDLGGLCAQARVVVTVTLPADNQAPIARDDVFEVTTSAPQRIDVLGNDEDPDGDRLRIVSVSPATQGEVAIGTDQKIVYSPVATLIGGETLTYTVCDPWDACDEATLSIVREAPDLTKFELSGGVTCQSGGGSTLVMLGLALLIVGWRRRRVS